MRARRCAESAWPHQPIRRGRHDALRSGYTPAGGLIMDSLLLSARFTDLLARSWKYLLLRGMAAIAFGILAWMRPGISALALTVLFGAYALVDGLLAAWSGLRGRKTNDHWSVLLLLGILG